MCKDYVSNICRAFRSCLESVIEAQGAQSVQKWYCIDTLIKAYCEQLHVDQSGHLIIKQTNGLRTFYTPGVIFARWVALYLEHKEELQHIILIMWNLLTGNSSPSPKGLKAMVPALLLVTTQILRTWWGQPTLYNTSAPSHDAWLPLSAPSIQKGENEHLYVYELYVRTACCNHQRKQALQRHSSLKWVTQSNKGVMYSPQYDISQ